MRALRNAFWASRNAMRGPRNAICALREAFWGLRNAVRGGRNAISVLRNAMPGGGDARGPVGTGKARAPGAG